MQRREFLRNAALFSGAAVVGGPHLLTGSSRRGGEPRGLLERSAKEAPIDTVVVVMMENRSFDHYLGWLADDERYLERGKSRYGRRFHVDGNQRQQFAAPDGSVFETASWLTQTGEPNPYRGCGHPDPGHQWDQGRAQRDFGFLAAGAANDIFALSYYERDALPFLNGLAREFTVFDRWHCSVLGPTYPNRAYLHAGQSGGYKANVVPAETAGYPFASIWDRLGAAGVPAKYYGTDLPVIALWGQRLLAYNNPIDAYFTDAAAGTLPNVVFVDPAFLTGNRTDDHPHADIRAGQRFLRDVFQAFAESKHWKRGAFIVTYDEWGGFFDHVAPPILPDDLANPLDTDNFGQSGFRVPAVIASPYARRGFVDHHLYDHTSVLRFLEWRFLGAPARGPGKDGDTWFLTSRDRNARNLGAALLGEEPDRDIGFDLDVAIDEPSLPCAEDGGPPLPPPPPPVPVPPTTAAPAEIEKHSFEVAMDEGYFEQVGYDVRPSRMAKEWAHG
ncbi:MAG TPA: alkaline phosphatase family protein [Acidimicrobiia bacterium]|nr:alkaline phosphatase family protein [Acidimicrobiia bacterium]